MSIAEKQPDAKRNVFECMHICHVCLKMCIYTEILSYSCYFEAVCLKALLLYRPLKVDNGTVLVALKLHIKDSYRCSLIVPSAKRAL